jgi:hypothetical protein
MSTPSFTQVTARFRNDDGSETAATWKATQGTNISLAILTPFRLRFLIDETASVAWTSIAFGMRTSKNGGAFGSLTGVTMIDSANFTNAANTTSQLTGGTGTFVTSNAGMRDLSASPNATNSGTAGQLFECEFSFQLDNTWAVGDTCDIRIYNESSAAAIAAYTFTPRITVIGVVAVPQNKPSLYQPFLAQ